jgi:hypothetical protein
MLVRNIECLTERQPTDPRDRKKSRQIRRLRLRPQTSPRGRFRRPKICTRRSRSWASLGPRHMNSPRGELGVDRANVPRSSPATKLASRGRFSSILPQTYSAVNALNVPRRLQCGIPTASIGARKAVANCKEARQNARRDAPGAGAAGPSPPGWACIPTPSAPPSSGSTSDGEPADSRRPKRDAGAMAAFSGSVSEAVAVLPSPKVAVSLNMPVPRRRPAGSEP